MRFSIVIPAYNAEKFIKRSINSILHQTFTDFEIIVVNDGSKDNTFETAKEITDERIRVLEQKNSGVSVARNTGITAAKGDYVCFLDADDEYLPTHLEQLNLAILQYPKQCFFATRFCIGYLDGTVSSTMCSDSIFVYENVIEEIIKEPELVWTGCVCVKREMFGLYGAFEPGVRLGEDTDMWRRLYVHTGLVLLDKVTVKRNRDGSEATKTYKRKHNADPLHRVPMFLADSTIDDEIKESLKTEFELSKIEVVRTYLLEGDKKRAREEYKRVDKCRVPFKKKAVTSVCFLIPPFLLRLYIKKKNESMYRW